jgi:hypothetical protein
MNVPVISTESANRIFRGNRYPWDEWFDGQTRELSLREHFPGFKTFSNLVRYIRLAASRKGIKVQIRTNSASEKLLLRAIRRGQNAETHNDMEAGRTQTGKSLRDYTPGLEWGQQQKRRKRRRSA